MKSKSDFSFVSVLIMIAVLAAACGSSNNRAVSNTAIGDQPNAVRNMNESTAKNVEVKTDIEGLEKLISLPVRPQQVKWTAEFLDNSKGAVPGPSDHRLTALLKYDEKTAAELVQKLETETTQKSLGNADVKAWFSDDIKSQAKTIDGRTYLEGAKYSSKNFARAPYLNGSLVRIGETNYFVLNLFSF